MDYMNMAEELLDVRIKMVQVPYTQMISRLERGEIFVLNYLVTHEGPIHPKDLSNAMAVSTARIASLLNKLEEKKEVQRIVDPDDKRQLIILLTENGRARILKNREETLPSICAFLESLGPDDAAAYIRIEKKLWNMYQESK